MKVRAILLAAILVLSVMAVGMGSASVTQPTTTVQSENDSTPTATSNASSEEPVAIDIPPSKLTNMTLNRSSLPANITRTQIDPFAAQADQPQVGTIKFFPSLNYKTGTYYFKKYKLRAYSEHGAIWVALNLSWPADDPRTDPVITDAQIQYLMEEFEQNIYPTESRLFGEPKPRAGNGNKSALNETALGLPENYWRTDGESRTVILVDNIRDKSFYNASYPVYVAGYYSPIVQQWTYRNIITLDAASWEDQLGTPEKPWWPEGEKGEPHQIEGTLAHEYQHLIHSDLDGDETTWINEGMADLAQYAVGYGHPVGHVTTFEKHPGNSLTNWEDQIENLGPTSILADYGHAYLFQLYLYEQYGPEFISNLAHDTDNGIESVEDTLSEIGANGAFASLYQDFSTALVMDSLGVKKNERYHFDLIDLNVSTTNGDGIAAPWGNEYNTISIPNSVADVSVNGTAYTPMEWSSVPGPLGSGDSVLYSGQGNQIDHRAIFKVDLSGVENPALVFDTYYDIERGWDYAFVQVSTDGGETWTSLTNKNTSTYLAQPNNAYPAVKKNLPGFTGDTNGTWVTEKFDLSEYAGEKILISFYYQTDWAAIQPGWYVDDIRVTGTDTAFNGTTVEPFKTLQQVRENRVSYQYTMIGVRENGKVTVKQLDMRTFKGGDAEELEDIEHFLNSPNLDHVIFTTTWTAPPDTSGSVPYDFDFDFHERDDDDGEDGEDEEEGEDGERDEEDGDDERDEENDGDEWDEGDNENEEEGEDNEEGEWGEDDSEEDERSEWNEDDEWGEEGEEGEWNNEGRWNDEDVRDFSWP